MSYGRHDGRSGGTAAYHAIMAWSASITVHVVVASLGAVLAASAADARPITFVEHVARQPAPTTVTVELPSLSALAAAGWLGESPVDAQPELGGERMPRPDTGSLGRGGDGVATQPAINLAARDDEAHLTPLLQSRLERAQHARHREGHERSSPEDDSVSDRPMIATIFVLGQGSRYEQRPYAQHDPGAGSYVRGAAKTQGGDAEQRPIGYGMPHRPVALSAGDSSYDAMGSGALDSWWHNERFAANVMSARPFSLRGRTASLADRRGDHQDTVDAEQEDITTERDLFHASTAGGPRGVGVGGERSPGPTGSGGERGSGSRSQAQGTGHGDGVAIDPADQRRRMYRRIVAQKIQSSWSARDFPKEAVPEGKNGYTLVSFVIHQNGTVSGVQTTRNSGFPTFDAKMRAAVRRAAPFGPLPADFGGSVRVTHPFRVDNPAVR